MSRKDGYYEMASDCLLDREYGKAAEYFRKAGATQDAACVKVVNGASSKGDLAMVQDCVSLLTACLRDADPPSGPTPRSR